MRRFNTLMSAAAGIALAVALQTGAVAAQDASSDLSVQSFSGAYLAARAAEVDNNLDRAAAYYRRALAYDPGNEAIKQSLMILLISRGDFDEALPLAEELKDVPEVQRFSRLALAVDAIRNDELSEAAGLLDVEDQTDLDRLIMDVAGAWIEAETGEPAVALTALDELEGPAWYELFVNYHTALIAAASGLDATAQTAFEATVGNLEAGGAAPETFLRAAEAFAHFQIRNGDSEAALETIARAEELAPGRVTLAALRDQIEAGSDIEPLVADAREGTAEILLNLATALNRGGGESFVRLYLQYALALDPESDVVLLQLGGIAEQQQESEAAIALYGRIPEDSPIRQVSELQVGLNLADLDRHDEAIAHLKPLLDSAPEDRRAYLALGGVYASQKNYAEAAKIYDAAVAQIDEPQPADWNLYYQRGIAYERLKQWEKAEPNFHQALELSPEHPQVLNYLGYSWVDMNIKLEEGLELIRKAVELRPSDGYIVDSLGWAYYRLGRYEDAVRELERAVNLMPNDPILNDHLGDAYWRVGRRLEAGFQWAHARDLEPEPDLLAEIRDKLADGLADQPASVRAERAGEDQPPPPPPTSGGRS